MVGLRVAVGGERHGDHDRVEMGGHEQGGAQQRDRGQLGRAVADQRQQHDRSPRPLISRSCSSVSASVTGTNVRPAYCSRTCSGREVEPAERAVLGVGQRRDRPGLAGDGDPGQRQPLGVDQLDLARLRGGGEHVAAAAPGSPGCPAR